MRATGQSLVNSPETSGSVLDSIKLLAWAQKADNFKEKEKDPLFILASHEMENLRASIKMLTDSPVLASQFGGVNFQSAQALSNVLAQKSAEMHFNKLIEDYLPRNEVAEALATSRRARIDGGVLRGAAAADE